MELLDLRDYAKVVTDFLYLVAFTASLLVLLPLFPSLLKLGTPYPAWKFPLPSLTSDSHLLPGSAPWPASGTFSA